MGRKGMTMVEMVIVFVIIGIMTAFAFPRVRDALQRENVRSARVLFSSYHSRARNMAILRRSVDTLHLSGTAIRITVPKVTPVGGNTLDTVARDDFYARYKVNVVIEPSTRQRLIFDPRGIGMETSNTVIRFTKGNFKDSLVITSTGRIQ